eukprot:INCI6824.1.p1 GENE.INCI6824.1~~INCI6824.1.p1  ORF type:complete len:148 (+),score=31.64 INCI6824.1:251-694(+)
MASTDDTKKYIVDQAEYARFMRKAMSKPECIDADGNLNMEYFRPKVLDNITWTDDTIHDLIEGIKRHGVGQWSQIQADFLPMLAPLDIRIKVNKLLGKQNLSSYMGWKGDREAIAAEFEKNKKIAMEKGLWKYGVMLDENIGNVVAK